MGGSGSGYYIRWNSKSTTESMYRVDLRYMKKEGLLFTGRSGSLSWVCNGKKSGSIGFRVEENRLALNYRNSQNGGEWESIEDFIYFTWTPCNFGGQRRWFRCPSCGRRVVVLYGGKYFRCRHCHNLTYSTQNESLMFRLLSKAQKIRKRLGGSGATNEFFPPKPKGMHWKTYWKLEREAEEALQRSIEMCVLLYGYDL